GTLGIRQSSPTPQNESKKASQKNKPKEGYGNGPGQQKSPALRLGVGDDRMNATLNEPGRKRPVMRPVPLKIGTGDFSFAAGHRQRTLPEARQFQTSLLSRCTAMRAGLRTLIQTRHGPDRYVPSSFFDTMPSAPSRQTCAKTTGLSLAMCSLNRMPASVATAAPARPCAGGRDREVVADRQGSGN